MSQSVPASLAQTRRLLLLGAALALAGCDGSAESTAVVTEAYTSQCAPPFVEGTDVSDQSGPVDWAKVAASGRSFVFVKATQGDYNTQAKFPANWSGSKTAGVLRSPYHFFDATIDGVTQAQHFLAVLNANGGLQYGDLPPMLDLECPTSPNADAAANFCEGTGSSGWVPTATLVARVMDWLTTVEQATGRKPIVYTYTTWYSDLGFTDASLGTYPLFIATPGSCAWVPSPWAAADFWQYSISGTVPGISGPADVDRFFGTGPQLVAFANGPSDAGADAAPSDAAGSDATSGTDSSGPEPPPDTGTDSDSSANGAPAGASHGCGCRVGASGLLATPFSVLAVLALGLSRRRRRGFRRPTRRARSPLSPTDRDSSPDKGSGRCLAPGNRRRRTGCR